MRLCANESMAAETVLRLRQAGHDVLWIRETAPGSLDMAILSLAQDEGRVLLTFDKDFGELVFRYGGTASCGIVLFRISQPSAARVAERICAIIASRNDREGHYSVVDDTNVRMRELARK